MNSRVKSNYLLHALITAVISAAANE